MGYLEKPRQLQETETVEQGWRGSGKEDEEDRGGQPDQAQVELEEGTHGHSQPGWTWPEAVEARRVTTQGGLGKVLGEGSSRGSTGVEQAWWSLLEAEFPQGERPPLGKVKG